MIVIVESQTNNRSALLHEDYLTLAIYASESCDSDSEGSGKSVSKSWVYF